jgi:hypothetical protein
MSYIKRFNQYISENKDSDYLLYYAFDWDDNILYMPTVIHMEKKVGDQWVPTDVSTAEFAEVRGDKENWRTQGDAFSEFRDNGPRGVNAFIEDVDKAISMDRFGPAWGDFMECLSNGCVFAIITARGHESEGMRLGIDWIIDNILTEEQLYSMYNHLLKFAYLFNVEGDKDRVLRGQPSKNELVKNYLDSCDLVGVSSPSRGGSPSNPEKAKEEALLEFKSKVNTFAEQLGMNAKIGFSDDDLKNVKHIEDLVDSLHNERFPNIREIIVKGTKDPLNITKKTRTFPQVDPDSGKIIETQSNFGGGAGNPMSSSVVPFSSFNTTTQGEVSGNFSPGGSENRQDTFGDRLRKQTKFLTKTSKEIFKNRKKKD